MWEKSPLVSKSLSLSLFVFAHGKWVLAGQRFADCWKGHNDDELTLCNLLLSSKHYFELLMQGKSFKANIKSISVHTLFCDACLAISKTFIFPLWTNHHHYFPNSTSFFSGIVSVLLYDPWGADHTAFNSSKKSHVVALWQNEKLPSSRMGLGTPKGSSCSGSMYLWPALRTLICGRHTTRVVGMEAWLWYQLRTVPGMSLQMMVLGDGRLSLGRNTQHDWSSNWWEANTAHSFVNCHVLWHWYSRFSDQEKVASQTFESWNWFRNI